MLFFAEEIVVLSSFDLSVKIAERDNQKSKFKDGINQKTKTKKKIKQEKVSEKNKDKVLKRKFTKFFHNLFRRCFNVEERDYGKCAMN